MGSISSLIESQFLHFNAGELKEAAKAYRRHIDSGGKMMVTLAGAMSTARIGISLAEMIRQGKVHAISCTGANLEEDVFNLIGREEYLPIPDYRVLTPRREAELLAKGYNRVTDTCIPESIFEKISAEIHELWLACDQASERRFPHEFLYELLLSDRLTSRYQIEPKDSWVLAAAEKGLPMFVPGWEDSTLGNFYAAERIRERLSRPGPVKSGIDYMEALLAWYQSVSARSPLGFFQIGGGIAGDFAICSVPLLKQELKIEDVPLWAYFCQISDSTTSYGSYSGAVPNEKITWGKLDEETPKFQIESDATIVVPLIFAYVMGQ